MKFFASMMLLCSFVVTPCFTPAAHAEAGVKDVIATVERGYNSLNDLQASFVQKSYVPSLKRDQAGSGTLFIRKGSGSAAMFRFDYRKPKQLIVSDGRSIWFYLPENRQVMQSNVRNMFEGDNGIALNYLTGMGRISRDFSISPMKGLRDASGNYLLELVPKKQGRNLAKLQLTVSAEAVDKYLRDGSLKNTFPIVSSVVTDQFGTRTSISFSNVKVNRGLKNSLFTFKVPAGVEVIKP